MGRLPTPGTKEDSPVPTVVTGSIPNNKSDLKRFYVATQRLNVNDFLYLAWERVQSPSGTDQHGLRAESVHNA
jgi:hypothetical protein